MQLQFYKSWARHFPFLNKQERSSWALGRLYYWSTVENSEPISTPQKGAHLRKSLYFNFMCARSAIRCNTHANVLVTIEH